MSASPRHPWIDDSQSPLYVYNIPKSRGPGELEASLEVIHQITRHAPSAIAWVVDGSNLLGGTAKERSTMAAAEKHNAPFAKKVNVGTAIVAPTALVRGLYTAITWLAPPSYPAKVFSTFGDAHNWATAQLQQQNFMSSKSAAETKTAKSL